MSREKPGEAPPSGEDGSRAAPPKKVAVQTPTSRHGPLAAPDPHYPTAPEARERHLLLCLAALPPAGAGLVVFGWHGFLQVAMSVVGAGGGTYLWSRVQRTPPERGRLRWLATGVLVGLLMPPEAFFLLPLVAGLAAEAVGALLEDRLRLPGLAPAAVFGAALQLVPGGWPSAGPVLAARIPAAVHPAGGGTWGNVRQSLPASEYFDLLRRGEIPQIKEAGGEPYPAQAIEMQTPLSALRQARKAQPPAALSDPPEPIQKYLWPDFLLGYLPASFGASSAAALLLAGFFLWTLRQIRWRLSGAFLAGTLVFAWLMEAPVGEATSSVGRVPLTNLLAHVLAGSGLFAAVYLASARGMPEGRLAQGLFGLFWALGTLVLRRFDLADDGALLALVLTYAGYRILRGEAPPLEEAPPASLPKLQDADQPG